MFGVHWCLMVTPPLVQMEYLQKKEYFPFKTGIIDDSLQITLGKKNNRQVSLGIFLFLYLYSYRYYSPLHRAS